MAINNLMRILGYSLGIIGFIALFFFEVLKCKAKEKDHKGNNPFFIIGTVLLLTGWILIITCSLRSQTAVFIVGAMITAAGLLLYALVLSKTSGGETYTKDNNETKVCEKGIYGVVRHPGLWCFWLLSAGVSMMFPEAGIASALFAVLNTVYIIFQDLFFFPVYIQGYDEYKRTVPFCFPNKRKGK